MTTRFRSASFHGESIFMEKDFFPSHRFGCPWTATAASGRFGTGNQPENLSSQKSSMLRIPNYTRLFSPSTGQLPTGRSARREAPCFTPGSAKTTKVNFTLFISNNAILEISLKTIRRKSIYPSPLVPLPLQLFESIFAGEATGLG